VPRDLEPHFGIHGVYELARGFLADQNKVDAQRNFAIVSELEPVFGPTPEMLFDRELDQFRTGAVVIPVLDELNRASVRQQVIQMAAGRLEAAGREFLLQREATVVQDHSQFTAQQLFQVRDAVAAGAERPKTLEEAFARFDDQVPGIIRQLLGSRVTPSEAVEFRSRLEEFPALRSAVRANLYLWAIPLMHDAGASRDKNDDYRHVVEASYAAALVTGDEQLARTAPRIHPGLRQRVRHGVQIRPVHVGAHRLDGGPLPPVQACRQQPGQARLRPIGRQADHFAVHQIREHGVELLPFAAVDFIRAQVSRPAFRPCAIPCGQKRFLSAAGFAPTDPMSHGGVRRRHRLDNRAQSAVAAGA
jgi:hypothetical protein